VRILYSVLFYILLPFVFIRLLWKSRRQPAYRQRLAERVGFYPFKLPPCIWIHAVSMGETIAAVPLIKALQSRYPHLPLLVTTMTPTGAERVKMAFAETVTHVYLPYDLPGAVQRFLNAMQPIVGIIMETELWPNLLAASHARAIPICLVNARLSEKSADGYARVSSLTRAMLQSLKIIAAHGQVDAKRFVSLGAPVEKVMVTGNLKFDLELPEGLIEKSRALRESLAKNRFVWIAASTHEGEEEIILAAHQLVRRHDPEALLILVPRHPDRFDAIAKLSEQSFKTQRRSLKEPCRPETAVYLGDTMGELLLMYGAADVAFVGGSFIPRGGHNMLEPGALSKPILTGPYLFNFAEISELFFSAHAMLKVEDAQSLAARLIYWMQHADERLQTGQCALQVVAANRGALHKQIECVRAVIENQLSHSSTPHT
jgi:3-deoxy-D-manno-octulosonic-acid transferase